MGNTVLLVVDVQTSMVENHPYNESNVLSNIKTLISLCREKCVEVIYVRHDGGIGDELERGTDGWQIWKDIEPLSSEQIFDKRFNSAFRGTGLAAYLDSRKIQRIILAGLQTEYCIDTTCKVAFEYGYEVLIPEESTSTYDNEYFSGEKIVKYYTQKIWKDRFAQIIPMEELKSTILL